MSEAPHYELTITPFGNQSEIRQDGTLIEGVYRVNVSAAVASPTRIELHQHAALRIEGHFGEEVRWHDCPHCCGHQPDGSPAEPWSHRFPGAVNITTVDDAAAGHSRFRLEWDEPITGETP